MNCLAFPNADWICPECAVDLKPLDVLNLNLPKKKGLSCGVYMSYYVLKALCKMGRYEEVLSLILSEDERSWLNMISEGATTCFEAWGKEQKHNTSLCHPWAFSPIIVLAYDILPNIPWVGTIIKK